MSETEAGQTLAEQHLAFKQRAAEILHDEADERDWCSAFDEALLEAGLPIRQGYLYILEAEDEVEVEVEVVGENTVEEFEAWKTAASAKLYSEADRHGIEEGIEELLVEAGLRPRSEVFKTVTARIEGKFSVLLTVEAEIGKDLIDQVGVYGVRSRLNQALYAATGGPQRLDEGTNFTWKLVVDETGQR